MNSTHVLETHCPSSHHPSHYEATTRPLLWAVPTKLVPGEVRRLYCARHLCSLDVVCGDSVGGFGRGDKYTSLTHGLIMVIRFEVERTVCVVVFAGVLRFHSVIVQFSLFLLVRRLCN